MLCYFGPRSAENKTIKQQRKEGLLLKILHSAMSLLIPVMLSCLSVGVALLLWKWYRLLQLYEAQGVSWPQPCIPLIGHVLHLKRDAHAIFLQVKGWTLDIKHHFVIWLGPLPIFLTYSPDEAEAILTSTKLNNKSWEYVFIKPWLGDGLLMSTGEKWRKRRKMLTPAFHFGILKGFLSVFKRHSDVLIKKLEPLAKSGEWFDLDPFTALCTLDAFCETAFGVELKAQDGQNVSYVEAHDIINSVIQERQKCPWLWWDHIYKYTSSGKKCKTYLEDLHGFTKKVLDSRIASRKIAKVNGVDSLPAKGKLAFLDLLLSNYDKQEIDKDGIEEEVNTFMTEGFQNTAHSIAFTLFLLGDHTDIQRQVQQEVDRFYDDDIDKLDEQMKEMHLLDRVIKESLRLFPVVPLIGRRVEEDQKVGKLTLYKGTTASINIGGLHTNPDVWEDPLTFNPGRFLPEKCQKRHPFAYLPFSAGSRNCVGQRFALMEEKVVIATFLRHFSIESQKKFDSLKLIAELVLRPCEAMNVRITRRR